MLWGYLVDFLLALNHAQQRVVEPVLELRMAGKDLGHEEVHEGPQLHQVILQGCACKVSVGLYGFAASCKGVPLGCCWGLQEVTVLCLPSVGGGGSPTRGVDYVAGVCLQGVRGCTGVCGTLQGVPAGRRGGLQGFIAFYRGMPVRCWWGLQEARVVCRGVPAEWRGGGASMQAYSMGGLAGCQGVL